MATTLVKVRSEPQSRRNLVKHLGNHYRYEWGDMSVNSLFKFLSNNNERGIKNIYVQKRYQPSFKISQRTKF